MEERDALLFTACIGLRPSQRRVLLRAEITGVMGERYMVRPRGRFMVQRARGMLSSRDQGMTAEKVIPEAILGMMGEGYTVRRRGRFKVLSLSV